MFAGSQPECDCNKRKRFGGEREINQIRAFSRALLERYLSTKGLGKAV